MNENPTEVTQISKAERKRLKRERRVLEKSQIKKQELTKKIISRAIATIAVGFLVYGLIFYFNNRQKVVLPPTTQAGHSETSPPSHIISEPMRERTHRHMLEHADGSGPPGVIINYNCQDFACEDDFVIRLTAIVNDYPEHVYLAPYPKMSERLVITREGKQEILETIYEERIRNFIRRY